ncbi:MAG: hypothetical protein U0610_24630 [bacterium]
MATVDFVEAALAGMAAAIAAPSTRQRARSWTRGRRGLSLSTTQLFTFDSRLSHDDIVTNKSGISGELSNPKAKIVYYPT